MQYKTKTHKIAKHRNVTDWQTADYVNWCLKIRNLTFKVHRLILTMHNLCTIALWN